MLVFQVYLQVALLVCRPEALDVHGWVNCLLLFQRSRQKAWKSRGASSKVVGILIYPPGWNRDNWSAKIEGGPGGMGNSTGTDSVAHSGMQQLPICLIKQSTVLKKTFVIQNVLLVSKNFW